MPLNRPPLALGRNAIGVPEARRWVARLCAEIERPELTECAELGVSELVTNALLHGEPPITVRVRGTVGHPRVEVHDSSVEPPVMPTRRHTRADDLLLTFGRGLELVARCSDAWGAEIEDDGKVLWFTPAADLAFTEGRPGSISGSTRRRRRRRQRRDCVQARILDVPVELHLEFQQYARELRREMRLLALANESEYPLAKRLSDLLSVLERQIIDGSEQVRAAMNQGLAATDMVVAVPRAHAARLGRLVELLDLADDFFRDERRSSLERDAEQQHFQTWYLTELARQAGGAGSQSWHAAQSSGNAFA